MTLLDHTTRSGWGARGRTPGLTAALALTLALTSGPALPARAAETPPDAAKVLDRYIEATGGKAAHDAIRNSVSKMTLSLPAQDVSFAMTVYAARPNQVYSLLESPMTGRIENGVSGDVVWDLSAMTGPRLREGQERTNGLRDATFDPWSRWREIYEQAALAGVDTVNGKPCDKVVVTPKAGKPRTAYFDRASGLLRRLDVTFESPAAVATMRILLDDYRKAGGILVAYRTEIEAMGQTRVTVLDSIAHNVDLPADRFEPPAEVKKLLEAKK